ncbi:hypothetical protein HQN90_08570 [Paenibacillus alba]|uniref:hypothetical protein n=1 Tax=Paenibacillus alba TaxID=1197127 RepID=UPI0015638B5C|nr:hypothetical protein [Paenibacillus alba]NQX66176.1 hypothetical protein [Paenibacillus alba]
MIDEGIDFQRISSDRIESYAGDRLFLLVGEDQRSIHSAKELMQSPLWHELSPVRNNLVHILDAKWNYDDSITLERLLMALPGILTNKWSSSF